VEGKGERRRENGRRRKKGRDGERKGEKVDPQVSRPAAT